MPTNVLPLRPDLLPDYTRHVEVAGKVWPVSITEENHGWLATHQATGCWGYGATVEAAMADCQDMMDADRRWYVDGEGARLYLHGAAFARRARVQACFGEAT